MRFRALLARARALEWVVYAKPPFGGPDAVLKYLARYTHRIAISNHRLLEATDDHVRFTWKDYRHGHHQRIMRLEIAEFARRFLLHVLPRRFVKLRYYGFLSQSQRGASLQRCRDLLVTPEPTSHEPKREPTPDTTQDDAHDAAKSTICPNCQRGRLVYDRALPRPMPP